MEPQASRCAACPTAKICLARSLDAHQLDALSHILAPPTTLAKGDFAYRLGDRTDKVHLVRSGALKTITITESGEEHVTGFHFAGEMCGLIGFTTGAHVNSAIALDTTSVCHVHAHDLPALWANGCDTGFLALIGQKEHSALQQRLLLGKSKADARLCAFLLQIGERQKQRGMDAQDLYLPLRKTDLANYLGMTLESLSRTLGRLSKADLISYDASSVRLERPSELRTIAGDY